MLGSVVPARQRRDVDLDDRRPRGQYLAGRSTAVHLLQPVDKIQPLCAGLGEVDHDVDPFRDREAHAVDRHGLRQQVAVRRDLIERQEIRPVEQRELVPTRRPGIVQPQTVAAGQNAQLRLDRSIRAEGVAEDTIQIEQIEHQLEVFIQHEVVEEDRDVEGAARQSDVAVGIVGVGHVFVAGVPGIEQDVGTEHPLVDVLRGEIDMMVMIPQRTHRLGLVAGRGGDAVSCRVVQLDVPRIDVGIMLILEAERIGDAPACHSSRTGLFGLVDRAGIGP